MQSVVEKELFSSAPVIVQSHMIVQTGAQNQIRAERCSDGYSRRFPLRIAGRPTRYALNSRQTLEISVYRSLFQERCGGVQWIAEWHPGLRTSLLRTLMKIYVGRPCFSSE